MRPRGRGGRGMVSGSVKERRYPKLCSPTQKEPLLCDQKASRSRSARWIGNPPSYESLNAQVGRNPLATRMIAHKRQGVPSDENNAPCNLPPSASRRYVTRLRAAMPREAMHARRKWGGGGLRTDPSRLRARKRRLQQASRGERRRTRRARQQKSLSGFSYVYLGPRTQATTHQRSLRMQTMPRSRVI
jgi:hypothetical protein